MSATNNFAHASSQQRNGKGENLYWGGSNQGANSAKMWYAESKTYKYNNPQWASHGHFTAMVWQKTTHVGCGEADGYLTCRYSPQGNMNVFGSGLTNNVAPFKSDRSDWHY